MKQRVLVLNVKLSLMETKYSEDQSLVFECSIINGKQFSISWEKECKVKALEGKKTWKKKLNHKKIPDISHCSKMYLVLNSYFPLQGR